jgi:hypothetical protein
MEPSSALVKSDGVTPSERVLKRMCDRTFLTLWSHPGVYRDQGRGGEKGDGKEVCDLLVIFEDHIVIFSDKECLFPESGDLHLDWSRWYRSAVERSAKQIRGAEKWIKVHPDRLFLDRKCTQPFPLEVPELARAKIHRIVVAHGASQRCQREFGGRGTLRIQPDIVGPMHYASPDEGGAPFTIGQIDPVSGFVHVLDDASLEIVMNELDTISDFVSYLSDKERLVLSGKLELAMSEVDLLADYLFPLAGKDGRRFSKPPKGLRLVVPEGTWEAFDRDVFRLKRREEDQVSYLWDRLIEDSTGHIVAGTEYYASNPGVQGGARVMRLLAREPRSRRRYLAASLRDLVVGTANQPQERTCRIMKSTKVGDPFYAFLLLLPTLEDFSYQEYRELRRGMLAGLCEVVKLRFPEAVDIVGIATEKGHNAFMTQDVGYRDARSFTQEDRKAAEEVVKVFGFLTDMAQFNTYYSEFPHPATPQLSVPFTWRPRRMKGRDRNQLCQCGSGKKYKWCCGRPSLGSSRAQEVTSNKPMN